MKRVDERIGDARIGAAENARPAANVGEKRLRGRLYGTTGGQIRYSLRDRETELLAIENGCQ